MINLTSCFIVMMVGFFLVQIKVFSQSVSNITTGKSSGNNNIVIKGLYDNYSCGSNFKANHGFSCLIEIGDKTYIFDAGKSEEILLRNCDEMKVDFTKIDAAIISHLHGDHMGGITAVLNRMTKPKVIYTPEEIQSNMREVNLKFVTEKFEEIKKLSSKVILVTNPFKIGDRIQSTGVMGTKSKEQSLILDTEKGLIVITGCAHPGTVEIVKKAKELTNKPVRLLIGGFHLAENTQEEILHIIKLLKQEGVEKCSATHCTGEKAIKLFKEQYKGNYVDFGVGKILRINSGF